VSEKRECQRRSTPDPVKAGADGLLDLTEVIGAEVGEFLALDVAPHEFGWVELGRVAGQALNGEPGALSPEVRRHVSALVRQQAIPDHDESATAKMTLELVEEGDERDVVVAARPSLEEEVTPPEVPPERQGHREGELRPIEGVNPDLLT
jgi:hypothetical protein